MLARIALGGASIVELIAALSRASERKSTFALAQARSQTTHRPLIVVGDPDAGAWTSLLGREYGCGSVCLDLTGCPTCPVAIPADITHGPINGVPTNSAVVYVSCVLEYVADPVAGWNEILRMAGTPDNVFLVTVAPWTATAALYPGAKNLIYYTPGSSQIQVEPVTGVRKLVYGGSIAGLTAASVL